MLIIFLYISSKICTHKTVYVRIEAEENKRGQLKITKDWEETQYTGLAHKYNLRIIGKSKVRRIHNLLLLFYLPEKEILFSHIMCLDGKSTLIYCLNFVLPEVKTMISRKRKRKK